MQDIDRIEVVRGPGSLLYGANAMSGVINMVPRAKDEATSAHASIGTYDNSVLRGRIGAHYNFTPHIGIWASLSGSRSDGHSIDVNLKDESNGSPLTAQGVDFHRAYGTAGRFWAGPLTVQWYYNQRLQRVPIGAWGSAFNDPRTYLLDERFLGELRFEPQIRQTLQLALRAHVNYYRYAGQYIYELPTETTAPHDEFRGVWFGAETRAVWTPRENIRLTMGGEAQVHAAATLQGITTYEADSDVYLDKMSPYNVFSPYVIGEWGAATWLRLSAGARLNAYTGFETSASRGPPVFRAAAIMKPRPTTVIKLIAGNAFRAPSVYEQYYHDGGYATYVATVPGRFSLRPEEIFTSEVEITQRFRQDWSIVGSGWVSRVDDVINTITVDGRYGTNTGEPDPNAITQRYINRSDPVLLGGLDLEVRREWRQGWMFSAYYGYQRARYQSDEPSLLGNPQIINAPEHLASVRGVVPIIPEFASIGMRMVLEAPRRLDLESDATTTGAVIMDATLSGNIRRFGLGYVLGVYNLADQRYDYLTRPAFLGKSSRQNGRTVLLNVTIQVP